MSDSPKNNPESPIAVSAALAKMQADSGVLAKSTSESAFKSFLSTSTTLTTFIDGVNRPSIEGISKNSNSGALQDAFSNNNTRSASSFATQLEAQLRDENRGQIQVPNVYNQVDNRYQPVSRTEITTGTPAQTLSGNIAKPEVQIAKVEHVNRPITFAPIQRPKPVDTKRTDNKSETEKVEGKEKDKDSSSKSDYEKWKETHKGKLTEFESKFAYLVDDFRANPTKYKSWYGAANKRTKPVRDLKPSDRMSEDASINTKRMASRGIGHWGPSGNEIASVGATTPEGALKQFLNSPDHREIMEGSNFRRFGVSKIGSRLTMRFSS